jgi:hypothetical protein
VRYVVLIQYSDAMMQHSDAMMQHSDGMMQHSDAMMQHSDGMMQHSDGMMQHNDVRCSTRMQHRNAINQAQLIVVLWGFPMTAMSFFVLNFRD